MPKVSVIIPIYGVEKYIERCARSLFEQTLDDIEYIFINDCTKDCSVEILEGILKEYKKRVLQTRIVSMSSNSGQAVVRRYGIQLAKGEYIIHCDSDDWVEPMMYETMYDKAKLGDYDVVICDYFISEGIGKDTLVSANVPVDRVALIKAFFNNKVHGSVWNKLVRTSLYTQVMCYPKDDMLEDLVLSTQVVYYSNRIAHISQPFYHYFVNESSISRAPSLEQLKKRFIQQQNNYLLIETFLKKMQVFDVFVNDFLKLKSIFKIGNASMGCYRETRKLWIESCPELQGQMGTLNISFSDKCKYLLGYLGLYSFVYKYILNPLKLVLR